MCCPFRAALHQPSQFGLQCRRAPRVRLWDRVRQLPLRHRDLATFTTPLEGNCDGAVEVLMEEGEQIAEQAGHTVRRIPPTAGQGHRRDLSLALKPILAVYLRPA